MAFFSLKLIYFLLTFLIFIATKNCSALIIKLIHRHSVESPFYPGNITRTERINLLAQSSSSSLRISKQTKNATSIRPRLDSQNVIYMIEVGIGTFPPPHPETTTTFSTSTRATTSRGPNATNASKRTVAIVFNKSLPFSRQITRPPTPPSRATKTSANPKIASGPSAVTRSRTVTGQ
ncbi:hypothetical protein CASFOL_008907 [Castilleja foliolosa]|uniref:Uncharacterized protein n=1 Tax=Castilleja foliolosa TaxID=1961234 RepID=A0ABD3E1B5_9LAMI